LVTLAARPRRPYPYLSAASALFLSGLLVAPSLSLGTQIQVDGRTLPVNEPVSNVREALVAARVTVDADDEVTPGLDAPVSEGDTIRVRRIEVLESTEEEKAPYRIVVRPASRGNRPYHPTVTQHGKTGLKRVTYRVRVVDGREVSRTPLREEVIREPLPQIVTSRVTGSLGSRGFYTGARTLRVLASAYDPGPRSCGKHANGRTCNGMRAGYGIIAVDPRVIPLGTKVFVPGYGYGVAADVGGAIKGNRIDLGYNSRRAAFQWGKKWVEIRIVD